jgi:hypothetical protein
MSANNKQAAEIAALTRKLNYEYLSHFHMKKKANQRQHCLEVPLIFVVLL